MKTRFFSILITFVLLLPRFSVHAEEVSTENNVPSVYAETAILMDADSGNILYEKNAHQKMYPASITKLMTILLALEHGELTDEITFSHDAVYSIEFGSAHIAIQEGETLTLEQVLRAIILRSANEASNGVAEYVDGSMEAFAEHMTERAKELGCKNTHFITANGLHDENHYTTAYDMALIAQELLTHDAYRSLMSETYYEIPPTNKQSEIRYLHNQHQMLNEPSAYYYEHAIGGKTGFTSEALNTLVTYAEKDGMELIAVVMKCNAAEHYTDTKNLFDYGFANYESMVLLSDEEYTETIPVTETYNRKSIERGTITAAPIDDISCVLPKGTDISSTTVEKNIPQTIDAPVSAGQTIGSMKIFLNNKYLKTVDLVTQDSIDLLTDAEKEALDDTAFWGLVKKIGIVFGILLLLLFILICITRFIGYMQYQKRKRRRVERRRREKLKQRQEMRQMGME